MCGRFFVDAKNREIDRLLESLPPDSPPVKLGDVYPSESALVLRMERDKVAPQAMRWGFPHYDGKGVIFNTRAETAPVKPMFADSFSRRPVAVPCNGFYEWQSVSGHKRKNKYLFRQNDGSLLWLAAFWKLFSPHGCAQPLAHFIILTREANSFMRHYHNRMPVLLDYDEVVLWLNGYKSGTLADTEVELEAEKCL